MGEIYPIGQTCQYLIGRAARHRRAGRYDKAMTLLAKAKSQFGSVEDVEFELARTYDEMGCESEACRAYLRVVRMGGGHRAQALFHLAMTSAQQADLPRAVSYFEAFAASDGADVSPEAALMLRRQLAEAIERPVLKTRIQRARALEQRAVERLHEGKISAAKRTISHSLNLHQTAQGHVLKACCHLISGEGRDAVTAAKGALLIRPKYVQAMCVLADALILTGDYEQAKKVLIKAAFSAHSNDALFSVAVECAKHGLNELTLILTKRLLKRDRFHVRALAMRACAFANRSGMRQAERLFGRLCTLMPEDGVFSAYYRAIHDGKPFLQPLTMAQDVTEDEAMARSMRLVTMLHADPDEVRSDPQTVRDVCMTADWAMHSPMAGANVTLIAIIMLSVIDTKETRGVLLDALTDSRLDDGLKRSILQAVSAHCDEQPVYADLEGRFVRLAAGASMPAVRGAEDCQEVVQRAAAALMKSYPDAAQALLSMWIGYLGRYGAVKGRMAAACTAALEYAYHLQAGRNVRMDTIAAKNGTSKRLAMLCVRRILRANAAEDQSDHDVE